MSWRPDRKDLPDLPGVYRFLDAAGQILYVGKAKSLRKRLGSYFTDPQKQRPRTRHMLSLARSVIWTVVGSETEALRLELSWIKEFKPRCNIQLRDDKSYPYLALTLKEEAPRLIITRKKIDGARHFGPYPSVWPLRQTLTLLQKTFRIRTCNDSNFKRALKSNRPCFAGQIGYCFGPCSQLSTFSEHRQNILALESFLDGARARLLPELESQMHEAAKALRFEEAAKYRDRLEAARLILSKSAVLQQDNVCGDFLALAFDDLVGALQHFRVIEGRIISVRAWRLQRELDQTQAELLGAAITQIFSDSPPLKNLFLSSSPANLDELTAWLSETAGKKVKITVGPRAERGMLLKTAEDNAALELSKYLTHKANDFIARSRALMDLKLALNLTEPPFRIEAYDVSHLGQTGVVGSRVVFEDGLPQKKHYRLYNLEESHDDTEAIFNLLLRRLKRLDQDTAPQLLLIDGGPAQLNAARAALEATGVNVALCALAKRLEELWLVDQDWPLILPRSSEALYLLQRLRDEAHRFALSSQRQKRRLTLNTRLTDVPGVGLVRARSLLKSFGSLSRIRAASPEDLALVPGINLELARRIIGSLKK